MKALLIAALALEAVLLAIVFLRPQYANAATLVLAANSVVVIFCATRVRRKKSCCQ